MLKSYAPIGRCIYCGRTTYADNDKTRKLGDEHIIPMSIGGTIELPEASCQKCETETSRIESACVNSLFSSGRPHLKYTHGRSKLGNKDNVFMNVTDSNFKVPIKKQDHPGTIQMFKFKTANEISGLFNDKAFCGQICISPVVSDFSDRVKRLSKSNTNPKNFNLIRPISADIFGRLLAKIAHSFTVAELGFNGFIPVLNSIITDEPPFDKILNQYVGSSIIEENISKEKHEICLENRKNHNGKNIVVCKIRLFSNFGFPSHYVVSGFPL